MKLIDAVSKNAHTLCGTRGQEHGRVRHLHGDRFYNAWDSLYGLFDVELLQLGRYAQSIQNSEINSMVSRIATTIPEKRKAQTSGFLIQFSPEKTRGAVERPSVLLGQGGFKPFLKQLTPLPAALTYTNDKARTDHSGQPPIYSPLAQPGQSSRTEQANQANLRIYAEENPKMSMPCSEVAGSNPAGAFRIPVITPFLEITHEVHGKPCFTPS